MVVLEREHKISLLVSQMEYHKNVPDVYNCYEESIIYESILYW